MARYSAGGSRDLVRRQVPDRGEIYHLDFAPSAGREQTGPHFGLVVSRRAYNAVVGLTYVAPITTVGIASRAQGLAVSLTGAGTRATGIIQCDQLKAVDLAARGAKPTGETVPDFIMEEVLAKIMAIFE